MKEHVELFKNGNEILIIYQDETNESPRSWDNLGTMVCFHNGYNLGDKHEYNHHDYSGWDDMKNDIIKKENVEIILPIYLYDHSGIRINTTGFSCTWDSGQIGWIFISKEKVRDEYRCKRISSKLRDRVKQFLISEVDIYDQFLIGDVYGFRLFSILEKEVQEYMKKHNIEKIEDIPEKKLINLGEEIDSCWGFYGDNWKENGLFDYANWK